MDTGPLFPSGTDAIGLQQGSFVPLLPQYTLAIGRLS